MAAGLLTSGWRGEHSAQDSLGEALQSPRQTLADPAISQRSLLRMKMGSCKCLQLSRGECASQPAHPSQKCQNWCPCSWWINSPVAWLFHWVDNPELQDPWELKFLRALSLLTLDELLLLSHFSALLLSRSVLSNCDPMNCSTPGFLARHCLLEFAQTHVHWVSDAVQPSHPLLSPSPPAFNLFLASGSFPRSWLFALGVQSIGASAQHHSFQWIFRTDLL